MQRIVIIGATGSGKSWLARQLAARRGLPIHDLDELYWLPGWIARPPQEFQQAVAAVSAQPRWIVTGNYSQVRDLLWPKADTLIWLDYSLPRTSWQLLRRTASHLRHGTLHCNGNRENWRRLLSRKSIFLWLLQSHNAKRRAYSTLFAQSAAYANLRLIRLTTPRATRKCLGRF